MRSSQKQSVKEEGNGGSHCMQQHQNGDPEDTTKDDSQNKICFSKHKSGSQNERWFPYEKTLGAV